MFVLGKQENKKVAQNHLQMFYYHKKLGMYLATLFQKMRRLEKASLSLGQIRKSNYVCLFVMPSSVSFIQNIIPFVFHNTYFPI